jgi:hypothetical protein
VLFIVFAISGFGILNPKVTSELTGGVFTRTISLYLHVNLAVPVLVLLMIHVLIGLKTALTRWGVEEGRLLYAFLIILGGFVTALIVIAQYLVS